MLTQGPPGMPARPPQAAPQTGNMVQALQGRAKLDIGPGLSMPQDLQKQTMGGAMRRVQIIRHGATELNNDDVSFDRIRGWKDVPLSPEGKQEAEKLAGTIAKDPPDVMLASDLMRAAETAKIISGKTGIPLAGTSPAFRPWNVGDFAGQLSSKVLPILGEYAAEKPDEQLPNGESFNDFRKRFLTGLSQALQQHQGTVAFVVHHRNERLLNSWAKDGFPPDGAINEHEFNQKGEPTGGVQPMVLPVDRLQTAAVGGGAEPPLNKAQRQEEVTEAKGEKDKKGHKARVEEGI